MPLHRPPAPLDKQHLHFVTGRLAAEAVRSIVSTLADQHHFAFSIEVLPITVAALMTPKWLNRHLKVPPEATAVVVPGYLEFIDDDPIVQRLREQNVDLIIGPTDCRRLPEMFGTKTAPPNLNDHRIEIIAEINHAPRLGVQRCVEQARRLIADGADRIDIGCDPQKRCHSIGDYVSAICELGKPVSIDTFDADEVADAVAAGADLWLSVNATNREVAVNLGIEVVAIGDRSDDYDSLVRNTEWLIERGVKVRADAILEPIGSGLADSIVRYHRFRKQFPDVPMMMGIGNLTELTDVDSAGINFLLLGICGELQITSVLTTQVINWARSSVAECEIARRLVHYSVTHGVPPKRLSDQLIMLRDDRLRPFPAAALDELSQQLRDNNYRLFAQNETLRLISAGLDLCDDDPFRLFEKLMQQPQSENVDASHAFYLGYEMSKAMTALQLGKQYEQDRSLDWGMLTVPEDLHRIARTSRHRRDASTENDSPPADGSQPGGEQPGQSDSDQ